MSARNSSASRRARLEGYPVPTRPGCSVGHWLGLHSAVVINGVLAEASEEAWPGSRSNWTRVTEYSRAAQPELRRRVHDAGLVGKKRPRDDIDVAACSLHGLGEDLAILKGQTAGSSVMFPPDVFGPP